MTEGLNGPPLALAAERAVDDLRRGRAVQLLDGPRACLVAAVETLRPPLLERLRHAGDGALSLHVTAERAALLGFEQDPIAFRVSEDAEIEALRVLAGLEPELRPAPLMQCLPSVREPVAAAAIRLAKRARLLPALLLAELPRALDDTTVLTLRVDELPEATQSAEVIVELVSRARVPLADALDCQIVLFRQNGEPREHLAIVIGQPALHADVPVRLHSACLTGDVLGSLRCDCGDQLKRALDRIVALGGGVLLYLDQEGRGIGLANKLRAYALQDTGLDTVDADQHLGFLPDERDYAVAAAMLRAIGIERIRLLTNNPAKIAALTEQGIQVVGRVPLVATVTVHNQRYLKAKLDRAGHLAE